LALPSPFTPKSRDFQRQVAISLAASHAGPGRRHGPQVGDEHAVASCPDARGHLRAAARAERLARQVERLERQVRGRTESLARQFDRVLQVLERWGYVQGWALTEPGARLARLYHEQDLLLAECAERGLFHDLRPAEMAALASVFTYEPRGPMSNVVATARLPTGRVEERWRVVQAVARDLNLDEEAWSLPATRPPDAGFAALAYNWARGQDLARALSAGESPSEARGPVMAAGDFVRNIKQLIDLLRQLGQVLPEPASASAARKAVDALFRGVVAASSVVGAGDVGEGTGEAPWTSTPLPTSSTA